MKSILAAIALVALTGCASFEQLQEQGREIRMRGSMANSDGFFTHTVKTPQGTYTVRGNKYSTTVYRNK